MPLERPTHDMITILKSSDPVELATGESALRDSGIPFFTKNQGVQHFIGIGQIGGRNLVTGQPEIQVTEDDLDRATEILQAAFGQPEVAADAPEQMLETEADLEAEVQTQAIRHARYSAVWAVLYLWGFGSLLAIIFGIMALRSSRLLPASQKGLAIFGLVLGLLGLGSQAVVELFGSADLVIG